MFEGILGNENIKQELIKIVELNKISHSYLFLGTDRNWKKINSKRICQDDFKVRFGK